VLVVTAFGYIWLLSQTSDSNTQSLSYSQFLTALDTHQLKTVTIASDRTAKGVLNSGQNYATVIPAQSGQALLDRLSSANVDVTASAPGPSTGSQLLSWALLIGPFILIMYFWRRLSGGAAGQLQGALGAGKSKAKVFDTERPHTTFADVAGYEGAKAEIAEVVDFLRQPERYRRAGATAPRGVLMIGPPGTGKTLLARAVAGEAAVPFFSVAGSSFVEMFVGVGAARVRDLFAEARKRAPAIVFVDEVDAIGGRRAGSGAAVANDEREQTLNQLLSEMDGFDPSEGIVVLAATNRPEVLDPALLRPGRFDRQVTIPLPTQTERRAILAVHCRSKHLEPDVDLDLVARGAPGCSGSMGPKVEACALFTARTGHPSALRRHRRLPDRHRVRRPHHARLITQDRPHQQPAAARRHRVRGRLRRRRDLPARAADRIRHRRAAGLDTRAAGADADPGLGNRRDLPDGTPSSRHPLQRNTHPIGILIARSSTGGDLRQPVPAAVGCVLH
jgi:cell division protease FtsH